MMENIADIILHAGVLGIGATMFMDIWALVQKRLFGIPSLDYAMVGRWIGHMGSGRIAHPSIGQANPIRGEKPLGWAAHYLIGIVFALVFAWLFGAGWRQVPTLMPALGFGLVTVVIPFFLIQPAFGLGIAASRTPAPWIARQRSLIAHLSFGVGLWIAGLALSQLPQLFN